MLVNFQLKIYFFIKNNNKRTKPDTSLVWLLLG